MPEMLPWLVLQSSSEPSMTQVAVGFCIVFAAAVYVGFLLIRRRDEGLPEQQRVVRDQVRGALDEGYPTHRFDAAVIRGEIIADTLADRLRDLFQRASTEEPETVREAGSEIRRALGRAWREQTAAIPDRVMALAEWAVAVLLFGSVAVATSTLVNTLGWTAGRTTVDEILADTSWALRTAIDWAVHAIGLFPFADTLASLGIAYGILALEQLYQNPWILAGEMLLIAVALLVLERRVNIGYERVDPLGWRGSVVSLLTGLVVIWGVGVAVAAPYRWVFGLGGLEWVGDAIGLVGAVIATVGLVVGGLRWVSGYGDRLVAGVETWRRGVTLLLAARAAGTLLRPVAVLAVAAYLIAGVAGGQLFEVWRAYQGAAIEVKLLLAGLLALVVIGLLFEVRAAAADVRHTVTEVWARERVRAGVALQSMPYIGVVSAFIIAYGWQVPVPLSLVIAILAGVVFKAIVSRYLQARRRYAERERGAPMPASLVVGARTVDTVDGVVHLLAVDGEIYAHERREALIQTGVEVLQRLARGETADPTVEEWYARHLREFGLGDWGETYRIERDRVTGDEVLAGKLPERVRKRVLDHLRDQPGRKASREAILDDVCGDIPQDIVRRRLTEMVLAGGLRERADGTVLLKRDIWAEANQRDLRPSDPGRAVSTLSD